MGSDANDLDTAGLLEHPLSADAAASPPPQPRAVRGQRGGGAPRAGRADARQTPTRAAGPDAGPDADTSLMGERGLEASALLDVLLGGAEYNLQPPCRLERDVLRVRQRSWALRAPSPRDSHDGMRRAPSIGRVRRRGRAARRMLLPAPALPTSGLRHGSGSKRSPRAGGGGHAAWPPRTTSSSTCAAASSLCMCRSSPQARRGESSVRPRDGAGVVGGIARVRSSDADGARRGWRFC